MEEFRAPKAFMHIDIDPNKLTRRCGPIPDVGFTASSSPPQRPPERLSYSGIDYHMEVDFTDDVDERYEQEQLFFYKLAAFLSLNGVNSSLERFE